MLQLNVTYQLRLSLYGTPEHQAAISDTNNVINITVLAANYPYGFFSFPSQFTTSTVCECSFIAFSSICFLNCRLTLVYQQAINVAVRCKDDEIVYGLSLVLRRFLSI